MNRRLFLQLGAAAAAGFALDPERLLWRPGAKTIFLPPPKAPGLVLDVAGGMRLQKGDIITITDNGYGWPVMAMNPLTRQPTHQLQQFIVTNDATGPTITVDALHPSRATRLMPMVSRGPRRRGRAQPLHVGDTLAEATAQTQPDGRWSAELVIKPRDRGWSTKRT
jgi:hypothetical protein